jgi:hypothetical protein
MNCAHPHRQNAVVGDTSAATPGGVRIGTPALTSRSMGPEEMKIVADFLHRACQIALTLQKEAGSRLLKDFVRVATEGDGEGKKALEKLNGEVAEFAQRYPLPGIPVRADWGSFGRLLTCAGRTRPRSSAPIRFSERSKSSRVNLLGRLV